MGLGKVSGGVHAEYPTNTLLGLGLGIGIEGHFKLDSYPVLEGQSGDTT